LKSSLRSSETMKIGEIARKLNISCSAIRFYERNGLIKASEISRAENGYRVYNQEHVQKIRLILSFKEIGLELNEIKNLLHDETASCGDLVVSLNAQIEKCKEMERLVKRRILVLTAARDGCHSACKSTKNIRACSI